MASYAILSDAFPISFEEQFNNAAIKRAVADCPNFGIFPFEGPYIHKDTPLGMDFTIRVKVEEASSPAPQSKPRSKMKIWVKIVLALFVLAVLGAVLK